MAQSSIRFATAKIKMKQASSVSQNDIARLSEAVTFNEALQVLVDIGFLSGDNRDYDFAVDRYVSNACNLVNKFTTDENLSKAMLLKFDGHNLKVLLKSRLLNIEPDHLYNCGTIAVDKLKHAVANHNYSVLPTKLKHCLQHLEKEIVTNFDPLKIDVEIDKAVYSVIFDFIKNLNNKTITNYFTKQVTFL
ncbi:MAG: V-type ATPase subunit, partial [Christensenellaceae bacterium]|nr:V-type ATPase subunit [Christensenellaceae bacterium]